MILKLYDYSQMILAGVAGIAGKTTERDRPRFSFFLPMRWADSVGESLPINQGVPHKL